MPQKRPPTVPGLDEFERGILARFEGKVKGRLRAAGDEFRILNRIVRRTAEGYEWEPTSGMLSCS